jgi:hypothetical protein
MPRDVAVGQPSRIATTTHASAPIAGAPRSGVWRDARQRCYGQRAHYWRSAAVRPRPVRSRTLEAGGHRVRRAFGDAALSRQGETSARQRERGFQAGSVVKKLQLSMVEMGDGRCEAKPKPGTGF